MADFTVTVEAAETLEVTVLPAITGGGASTWDELAGKPTEFPPEAHTHDATEIDYDNTTSGLAADNAQDAIDEVAAASTGGGLSQAEADALYEPLDSAYTKAEADARYVNEADHTKAAHDALDIDADTLDGVDSTGFAPIAHVGAGGTAHADAVAAGAAGFLTGADKTKLDGVESGATADQTAAEILTAVKTVDGTGSGLDADLLDGVDSTGFALTGDARIPTQGENDALLGTNGTPSSTNRFVTDTDSRNTNARTPTSHATSHQPGGSDAMAVDAAAATGSLRTLGTGATQAAVGSHVHAASAVTFSPVGTVAATDVQSAIAEVASEATGYTPPWYAQSGSTSLFAAIGDGDPTKLAQHAANNLTSTTPTTFGTTNFKSGILRAPRAISVTKAYVFGSGTSAAGQWKLGIYNFDTGAKIVEQTFATVAGWNQVTISASLTAGVQYAIGVIPTSTSSTLSIYMMPYATAFAGFYTNTAPGSAVLSPKSLGWFRGLHYVMSGGGTLESTLPSAGDSSAGTALPVVFIEGTPS